MILLENWELNIDTDQVLLAQGMDPEVIRGRTPILVEMAEQALAQSKDLIFPKVSVREFDVTSHYDNTLMLSGGGKLAGDLMPKILDSAEKVVVALCTIGSRFEKPIADSFKNDMVYGLALNGVAAAATLLLSDEVARYYKDRADRDGLKTTLALNPGMIGWPVKEGQKQIFALLTPEEIGVSLTSNSFLNPENSLTMVMGIGRNVVSRGNSCTFCTMQKNCKYQHRCQSVSNYFATPSPNDLADDIGIDARSLKSSS